MAATSSGKKKRWYMAVWPPLLHPVETHVSRLRAKLENPGCPELIATEPRVGYRFPTA